jgi:RNase P subunit RPR2
MIFLKKLANFLTNKKSKEERYKKWRNTFCPKCSNLKWKYSFAPFVMKEKKGLLVARTCGICSYYDTSSFFIDEKMKLDNNTTFETKK